MSEEIEEIPPYEDWTVKDLKAECSARGLNNAGKKSEVVERLYTDDEFGVDEVESEPGDEVTPETPVEYSPPRAGWVEGGFFYAEYSEELGRDDFNKLPFTETHHRFLFETYNRAHNFGDLVILGGPYDGSLVYRVLNGNLVTYRYSVKLYM